MGFRIGNLFGRTAKARIENDGIMVRIGGKRNLFTNRSRYAVLIEGPVGPDGKGELTVNGTLKDIIRVVSALDSIGFGIGNETVRIIGEISDKIGDAKPQTI